MTYRKVFFPPNRLGEALAAARPMNAQHGIAKSLENIRMLGNECLTHMDALIGDLDTRLEACDGPLGDEALTDLYSIAVRMIGIGYVLDLPEIDAAARSLCDLIDDLSSHPAPSQGPVRVHIDALRLLRQRPAPSVRLELLTGLERLRKHYSIPRH